MSKNQERSFTAYILTQHSSLEIKTLQGTNHIISTTERYDPFRKCMSPTGSGRDSRMKVYFRCYDDYYNIRIFDGAFAGKYFSKNGDGMIAALPAAGGNTTSFNLLDSEHNIITLDDLPNETATVYLKARNSKIINKNLWGSPVNRYYFKDTTGVAVQFRLDILQRNTLDPD